MTKVIICILGIHSLNNMFIRPFRPRTHSLKIGLAWIHWNRLEIGLQRPCHPSLYPLAGLYRFGWSTRPLVAPTAIVEAPNLGVAPALHTGRSGPFVAFAYGCNGLFPWPGFQPILAVGAPNAAFHHAHAVPASTCVRHLVRPSTRSWSKSICDLNWPA